MDRGWIKLHRKMTEWEWYKDPNTSRLFLHLLLTVNRKPGNWRGIEVPVGARITSIRKLAAETKLSERNVRTAIKHLISTHEVTQSTTATYTLIKVENYEKYQNADTVGDSVVTQSRHSSDTVVTTNKKERMKERNKERISVYSEPADLPKKEAYGKHKNVWLTGAELSEFISRFPDRGWEVIEEFSTWLEKKTDVKVRSYPAMLTKFAKQPKTKIPERPQGLPDWYQDTGQEFESDEERQDLLAQIEALRQEQE